METENDLNWRIIKITTAIKDKYPELTKYLEELEVTIPSVSAPVIGSEELRSYYNTLKDLYTKYKLSHAEMRSNP